MKQLLKYVVIHSVLILASNVAAVSQDLEVRGRSGTSSRPNLCATATQLNGKYHIRFDGSVELGYLQLSQEEIAQALSLFFSDEANNIRDEAFKSLISDRKLRIELTRNNKVLASCPSLNSIFGASSNGFLEGPIKASTLSLPLTYNPLRGQITCKPKKLNQPISLKAGDRLEIKIGKSTRLFRREFISCNKKCIPCTS